MKYIIFLFITVFIFTYLHAQSVGIGTTKPDSSAKLDIVDNARGILIPRMNAAQRQGIVAPARGLMVYETTTNAFWYFDGTKWKMFGKKHWVGEKFGGGTIFYIDATGEHGLVAAATDVSTGIRWNAGTDKNTMALADGFGAGKANTAIIIASQGFGDGTTYAARVCNEYSVTVDKVTYSDWYLPSSYELNLLYLQKALVGGFANSYYWASTEYGDLTSWVQNFQFGNLFFAAKSGALPVRAIRFF